MICPVHSNSHLLNRPTDQLYGAESVLTRYNCSVSQEILPFWNSEVHYCVHKSSTSVRLGNIL